MRNNKGFSLIEMIAVIFIASVVLLPLLVGLTGNIKVNNTMIDRSIASAVTTTTVQAFEEMFFSNIETRLNDPNHGNGILLKFSSDLVNDDCSVLSTTTPRSSFYLYGSNRNTCQEIFNIQSINRSFTSDEFMVFVYPAFVDDEDAFRASIDALAAQNVIPNERLRLFIREDVIEDTSRFRVLNIVVWIQYGESENQAILRPGLLSPPLELD